MGGSFTVETTPTCKIDNCCDADAGDICVNAENIEHNPSCQNYSQAVPDSEDPLEQFNRAVQVPPKPQVNQILSPTTVRPAELTIPKFVVPRESTRPGRPNDLRQQDPASGQRNWFKTLQPMHHFSADPPWCAKKQPDKLDFHEGADRSPRLTPRLTPVRVEVARLTRSSPRLTPVPLAAVNTEQSNHVGQLPPTATELQAAPDREHYVPAPGGEPSLQRPALGGCDSARQNTRENDNGANFVTLPMLFFEN